MDLPSGSTTPIELTCEWAIALHKNSTTGASDKLEGSQVLSVDIVLHFLLLSTSIHSDIQANASFQFNTSDVVNNN